MEYRKIPKFFIKRVMNKSSKTGLYFDDLVTEEVMGKICKEITGETEYEYDFVDSDYEDEFLTGSYNMGRLAILQYHTSVIYISFSDEKCEGRNSGIQSVPTAFNRYYMKGYTDKKIYFYFLPCSGNNATPFYLFMYRLMKTAGFSFLNVPEELEGKINEFTSIDDIIRARKENADKNSGNNATHIIKCDSHKYEIYGKTYGANKYDTSLICYAISSVAHINDQITLFEYNEKDLKELPKASLFVIGDMGKINIVNIDDDMEEKELEQNDSLRSPRFNAHLLDRLGERHCVLCTCGISEIIQGAHIWPVANIKKQNRLSASDKLNFATDGENGLWMCQNHHKLFDTDKLQLSADGNVIFDKEMNDDEIDYVSMITTVDTLPEELVTPKYVEYIGKRYEMA